MSFKELLEKYKEGNLTEEEKQYVESEIEKNETINEFLADEIDLGIELKNKNRKDSEIDNKKIKEVMNKKFLKVTIVSIVSVFIILLGAKYVISPIVDSFYYNPNKISVGEKASDIQFDMSAYTELNNPGHTLYYAYAEPEGFGKYNINIDQRNLFHNNDEVSKLLLSRNKVYVDFNPLIFNYWETFFHINLYKNMKGFEKIKEYEMTKDTQRIKSYKDLKHIKELPTQTYVAAYVDFKEDLSMEKLAKLQRKFANPEDPMDTSNGLDFKWVAIRVINEEMLDLAYEGKQIEGRTIVVDNAGFNPALENFFSLDDSADDEKYPLLSLFDLMKVGISYEDWDKTVADAYEQHFKSLLQYLYDRKDFNAALGKRPMQGDFYKNSLDYIEENGVKTYGVLVYGEAEDIISFMERDETDCIYISDIKVSKYSK